MTEVVQPPAPRYTVEDDGARIRVVVPSRANWLLLAFLIVWLSFWLIAECGALTAVGSMLLAPLSARPGDVGSLAAGELVGVGGFLLVWLCMWTIGGAFAGYAVLWMLAGREYVSFTADAIRTRRDLRLLTFKEKAFAAEHVLDLRASPAFGGWWNARSMELWGLGGGSLAFDYGAKTVRCGAGLEEAEARQIVRLVTKRFPRYAERAEA